VCDEPFFVLLLAGFSDCEPIGGTHFDPNIDPFLVPNRVALATRHTDLGPFGIADRRANSSANL